MIERLWYGWTAPGDADEYERRLREEILPGFADEGIEGFRGYRVLRRNPRDGGIDTEDRDNDTEDSDGDAEGDEVEFVTILRFDSLDAVREFAGEDYAEAHVPPEAREVLSRYDDRARHYEVRERAEN